MRLLGSVIHISARVCLWTCSLWAFILCLAIVDRAAGFWGLVIGLGLAPVTFFAAPWYALLENGDARALVIGYGALLIFGPLSLIGQKLAQGKPTAIIAPIPEIRSAGPPEVETHGSTERGVSKRTIWMLSWAGVLGVAVFAIILYNRPCEVTGEVFTTDQSRVQPASGVTVYAMASPVLTFRDVEEEIESLEGTEAEAIQENAFSGKASCGSFLLALVKQGSGLSGPADAEFYKVQQQWNQVAADPKFRSMPPQQREEATRYFWKQQISSNSAFQRLSEADKHRYYSRLVNDDSEDAASRKLAALPQTTADSKGQFSMKLARGKYLFLAANSVESSGVWATVATVDGQTKVILGDDNRPCSTIPELVK